MPTYVYETIPQKNGDAIHRYEIRQSMKDAPLAKHPETGEPIRRVITGGMGFVNPSGRGSAPAPAPRRPAHRGGCSCCH